MPCEGKQSRAELTMCAQKTPIGYNYSLEPVTFRARACFAASNERGGGEFSLLIKTLYLSLGIN
jgi:hypothetical protein